MGAGGGHGDPPHPAPNPPMGVLWGQKWFYGTGSIRMGPGMFIWTKAVLLGCQPPPFPPGPKKGALSTHGWGGGGGMETTPTHTSPPHPWGSYGFYMGPGVSVWDQEQLYGALSPMYGTESVCMGPGGSLWGQEGPYVARNIHMGPRGSVWDWEHLCGAKSNCMGPGGFI